MGFGVRNAGPSTAVAPKAEFRISTSVASGFAAAAPLVTVFLANLAAGASREETFIFTAPTTPGTYYIWYRLSSTEPQTNTNNDTLVSAALTVAAIIDLHPTNAFLRTPTAPPGGSVIVSWRTWNRGTISSPPAITQLRLTTSNATNGYGTAANAFASTPSSALSPNQDIETLYRFSAPTVPGTYYVWVVTDANQAVTESDEANNYDVSQALVVVNGTIDVQPLNISLSATTVAPGTPFTASWTIRNNGTFAAGTSESEVRLTTSNALNGYGSSPIIIGEPGTGAIPAGGAVTQNRTITAPPTSGTYYLWIIANYSLFISESNLTNNYAVSTSVTVAPPGTVDVQPLNISLSSTSVAPGATVTASWLVRNNANSAAQPSNSQLRITTSNAADGSGTAANNVGAALGTGSIAPGASVSQTRTFNAPTTPGIYYLWVVADTGGALTQSNTANDAVASVPLVVTPPGTVDVQPLNVALSSSNVAPGAAVMATWQIRNNGTISAPSSVSQLRLTTSSTSAGSATNDVGVPQSTGAINAGGIIGQTTTVIVPPAPGTYYLWVLADSGSAFTQSNVNNDAIVSGPLVVAAPTLLPNLAPQNIALLDSVPAGESVSLTWSLANVGNGNAPGTITGVTLNQSPIDPRATPSIEFAKVAASALTAGTSVAQSVAVVIPANLTPGTYYLWVKADDSADGGLMQSNPNDDYARSAPVRVTLPRSANRLANIATRGMVGTDANQLIAGFVVSGSNPKPVLIRAIGPGLSAFGISGILANTRLQLFRGTTVLLENDDWGTNPSAVAIAQAFGPVGAFNLLPNSQDSALLVTLDPGNYSAQVSGVGGTSGVALVEVYDASNISHLGRLANISTRAQVGGGVGTLIAGLVIAGDLPKAVLIRAVGPTLVQFGVTAPLGNPRLELYRGTTLITSNDDWGGAAGLSNAFTQVGAFALPVASLDSALLLNLEPGAYTAQVSSVSGASGLAIVEIYELP